MKALAAVLLALLLWRQPAEVAGVPARPGRGQVQDSPDSTRKGEEDEDEEEELWNENEDYDDLEDDDEDDEDDEDGRTASGSRGTGLQCYYCQNLHEEDHCNQMRSCGSSQPFCKTLISQGDIESGPSTTYSMWCADTCEPLTREVGGTLMTITCCQTNLCNASPRQGLPGSGAAGHPHSPETVATALLLSLLSALGLGATGS